MTAKCYYLDNCKEVFIIDNVVVVAEVTNAGLTGVVTVATMKYLKAIKYD